MTHQQRLVGFVLCLLMLGVGSAFAEPSPVDAKERGRRARRLQIIALKYMSARKRYPSRCPRCQGSGKRLTRRGQRSIVVDCTQCAGNGAWVSDKHYKIVQYKMRSPAFQKLPGIKDLLEREYKAARAGKPWPRKMARIRIKDIEMIDATHAVAWIGIDADRVPTETRWIWIQPKGKKRGDWCAFDNRADGKWPGIDARSELETLPTGGWDALSADEHRSVREAVAKARLVFRSVEYRKRGTSLLIRLVPRDTHRGALALAYVGGDALKLSLAVMRGARAWGDVQSEWMTQGADPWERVTLKPVWRAQLSRPVFDQTAWDTLDMQAQIAALTWQQFEHADWEPLQDKAQSKPEPEPEPEPTPTPEPGSEPEPTREPEPQPEPTPTSKPAPPAPSQPLSEPSADFKIPELSSKQNKTGNEGVADINKLFERAKLISNEASQAHAEGAHTLWQEKLAEVRSVLGEIEDVWFEQIVVAMPGGDEMERDMVANHYFGDVWGEVDKLKAIVRKVSTMR